MAFGGWFGNAIEGAVEGVGDAGNWLGDNIGGGLGGSLQNIYDYGSSELSTWNDQLDSDPMALILSQTPIQTRLTNWMFNRDSKPLRNNYMLSSEQQVNDAKQKGIDTNAALKLQGAAGNIAKGVLNAYTFGVGGTLADIIDRKYYTDNTGRNNPYSKEGGAKALASSYATSNMGNYDTGYGTVVNGAANGAWKGAVGSAIQGNNIGEGALYGGAGGAAGAYLGDKMGYGDNLTGSDMPSFGSTGDFYSSTGTSPLEGYTMPGTSGSAGEYFKDLKDNQWFQGLMGGLGAINPALGKLTQSLYGQQAGNNPWMNAGQTLGQLYNMNKQRQAINGLINGRDALRGAYSSVLEKQLAAKDASTGRRSQYGPRNVELQAKLAALDAQNLPGLTGLYDRQGAIRNQMLGAGLQGLWKNREALQGIYNKAMPLANDYASGLMSMFRPSQPAPSFRTGDPYANPNYFGGMEGE